ncbi:MAG TPA: hypothetical protein VG735_01305 [Caulobacterales bacterium]|jgi:hypothetical protein|nr:hypothetical protein [Caulobacterales bacterium]
MRSLVKILARGGVSAAAVVGADALAFFCAAPSARAGSEDPAADAILIRYADPGVRVVIQDSKWGPIGQLQAAIDRRAAGCGVTPVTLDGRFTRATADAMRAVAACRGASLDAGGGHVTVEAWQAITGERPPNALERAQTLARTMEGGDYDRLDWNVCVKFTGDQGSVLTWGPYGKTLGWGGELLGVLNRLDRATVLAIFEANGAKGASDLLALKTAQELGVASKHKYPGARALMESICAKPGQMQAWSAAFAQLGAMQETQAAYEEAAWGDSAWFRYVVERLEQSWRLAGLSPTEIDFAFFLDRSIHMGWGEPRFEAVDAALQAARYCLAPEAFTNARARLTIADAVRAKARPEDRLARDAMFLVDSEAQLSGAMFGSRTWPKNWRKLWSARTGIAASDVGLSDDRPAPHFGASQPS